MLQLLLLLDQTEDTADSERAQDGSQDSNAVTDAGPVEDQDYDCAGDNSEIENIPAISEVVLSLSNDLHDGFNSEDDHEDVVDDVDRCLIRLWLHIPVESENERVSYDARHYEKVEVAMLSEVNAPVSDHPVVAVCLELPLRYEIHVIQLDGYPGHLLACERAVTTEELLLAVKGFNDHTDEEFHEEHADEYDQDHRVQDH